MKDFDWSTYTGNLDWLSSNAIHLTVHGSHAYGTNLKASDLDVKGIAVPPKEYFHGYLKIFEQAEFKNPDATIFDIRKFFKLASDANPNVLETLFTDESLWYRVKKENLRTKLIENRNLFLSRKVRHTFSGYALAQLKRIKTHRSWLLSPKEEKPIRGQFSLPETTLLSSDIIGAMNTIQKEETNERIKFSSEIMSIYQKERAYHNTLREHQQYQNWKTMRNKDRAALEAKMGFDGKHASHLVRLTRSCEELLITGKFNIKRPDAEELLAIRNGAWSYDQLIEYAEDIDVRMEELEKNSPLPKFPDRNKLDQLCQEVVEEFLMEN